MRIWAFAVRRWQVTLLLFGLLIAVGVSTLQNIPRAEDPEFHAPVPIIVVAYPGADPADIERLIVDPIEDAISELDDIKRMDSRSLDGVGIIQVEFQWDQDPDEKYDEVVREVNRIRPDLPPDIADLEVRRTGSGLVNIMQVALVSDTASYRELDELGRTLRDDVETVPGVRRAEVFALPEPEVRVAVDLERMGRAGVTLGQMESAIRGQNAAIPGGAVDVGLRKFNVKTSGSYDSLDEIADTVVGGRNARIVRLRDVADVTWDTAEQLYVGRFNGRRAIFLAASAKDRVDVFDVRDGIEAKLAAFEQRLPPEVKLERGFDQTRNVGHRLRRLGLDFGIAITLVLLTLVPLGLRAASVVMISIPLSLSIGLAALYFSGFSLNQLSIAGFVLALGLLVDDSIVVVENIARYLRAGYSRVEAAIAATDQIALAVLGCTATLLFAFLPLLFLPEGSGLFIRSLPAAVLYTVAASLFVALTVIPFLASRVLAVTPAAGEPHGGEGNRALQAIMRFIHGIYAPALRVALAWPRRTLLAALAFVILSFGVAAALGFSLFPNADIPQFRIEVETPTGASVADTDRAVRFIERELARHDEIRHWFANVGHGNPRVYYNIFPEETKANTGEVFIELDRFDPKRTPALLEELRAKFDAYPGAHIIVEPYRNGPPINAPIEIAVVGPDLDELQRLAREAEALIAATPGARDVDNPARRLRTDLDLNIDTDKAALLGVAPVEVDRTVRAAVAGLTVGKFRETDGDEYDITLRLPMQGRQQLGALDYIQVASASGQPVPLRQLTNPAFSTAPSSIRRHDRLREIIVTAYTTADANVAAVTQDVLGRLERGLDLPPGYSLRAGGELEAQQETFGGIGTAVLVAVFGILAVLVLEFGSFRSMLIVAGVIPLGMAGGFLGLWVTGYDLSFTATIGLVALIGIEIKNSILLVDFTNQLREQGLPLDDAVTQAGEIRFLPIILTSATAIGGLLPLAVQGSGLYSPLAIVIIGGLLSSTLIGRLVTPVMYKMLPPRIEVREGAVVDASLAKQASV
ncbi:MAG TPA: efflux RND transporter permease subunit [Steroidobacteraceae bacterium]|nr:efflux RND transporter permease subunit [Steroidobacteraceae bacterium]